MTEKRGSGLGHMVDNLFDRRRGSIENSFIGTEQHAGEVHAQLLVLQEQLGEANSDLLKLSPIEFLMHLQKLASEQKIDVS